MVVKKSIMLVALIMSMQLCAQTVKDQLGEAFGTHLTKISDVGFNEIQKKKHEMLLKKLNILLGKTLDQLEANELENMAKELEDFAGVVSPTSRKMTREDFQSSVQGIKAEFERLAAQSAEQEKQPEVKQVLAPVVVLPMVSSSNDAFVRAEQDLERLEKEYIEQLRANSMVLKDMEEGESSTDLDLPIHPSLFGGARTSKWSQQDSFDDELASLAEQEAQEVLDGKALVERVEVKESLTDHPDSYLAFEEAVLGESYSRDPQILITDADVEQGVQRVLKTNVALLRAAKELGERHGAVALQAEEDALAALRQLDRRLDEEEFNLLLGELTAAQLDQLASEIDNEERKENLVSIMQQCFTKANMLMEQVSAADVTALFEIENNEEVKQEIRELLGKDVTSIKAALPASMDDSVRYELAKYLNYIIYPNKSLRWFLHDVRRLNIMSTSPEFEHNIDTFFVCYENTLRRFIHVVWARNNDKILSLDDIQRSLVEMFKDHTLVESDYNHILPALTQKLVTLQNEMWEELELDEAGKAARLEEIAAELLNEEYEQANVERWLDGAKRKRVSSEKNLRKQALHSKKRRAYPANASEDVALVNDALNQAVEEVTAPKVDALSFDKSSIDVPQMFGSKPKFKQLNGMDIFSHPEYALPQTSSPVEPTMEKPVLEESAVTPTKMDEVN